MKPLSSECEYIIHFANIDPDQRQVPIDDVIGISEIEVFDEALKLLEKEKYITTKNTPTTVWRTMFTLPTTTPPVFTPVVRNNRFVELTLKGHWYFWIHLRPGMGRSRSHD